MTIYEEAADHGWTARYYSVEGEPAYEKWDVTNQRCGWNSSDKNIYRTSWRWSLASIPDDFTEISKVELIVKVLTAGGAGAEWDVHAYDSTGQTDPCTETGQTFYDHCASGNLYVDDTTDFQATGTYTYDLGAQACTDVANAKTAVNRFSVGLHEQGDDHVYCVFSLWNTYIKLRVTYTAPVKGTINKFNRKTMLVELT